MEEWGELPEPLVFCAAVLGLTVGDTIDWPLPSGRTRRLRVVEITYQPEAAGDPI